jgi:hypothetical protein
MDPKHVADTITATSQKNQIDAIEANLTENPTSEHESLADLWPSVRPVLSFLENLFPSTSVWGHALRDLGAIGDAELSAVIPKTPKTPKTPKAAKNS